MLTPYICSIPEPTATVRRSFERDQIRSTLHALCLANRRFYQVFTPFLWTSASLEQDGKISPNILSSMIESGKLNFTVELEIIVAPGLQPALRPPRQEPCCIEDQGPQHASTHEHFEFTCRHCKNSWMEPCVELNSHEASRDDISRPVGILVEHTPNLEYFR